MPTDQMVSPVAPNFLSTSIANWLQDRVSTLRASLPLPPSPPIKNPLLGHLHDIRTEGYTRFHQRCVATYGPLVLLHFGPPVVGRRLLVIADPEVALRTLQQDTHREFLTPIGPPLVFGDKAVFCTSADDAAHAERQGLLARHLSAEMMSRHAAAMAEVWQPAVERLAGIPAGRRTVERFNFNSEVLRTTQAAAVRCWLGVQASNQESHLGLERYYDPGRLLSEVLFSSLFFLRAQERVAGLMESYRPLLSRSLDALFAGQDAEQPQLRFIAESLACFGWKRERLAVDSAYREQLLGSLDIYKHLFGVMLPAVGSTGGTMLFLLYELAGHPEFQESLRAELAATDLTAHPRPSRLMAMAIKEVLRLHPPAQGITRMLKEPRTYGGYFVPKGTYTFVHLHTLHRNARSYTNPEQFDPLRFAAPEAAADGKWAGFSLGRMACTGRSFAELHITTFFRELLSRYRIQRVDSRPIAHNDYQVSVTLQPQPFQLRFEQLN